MMIKKKRSKGVTFWGHLLLWSGIGYAIINVARNVWLLLPVLTPIFLIIVGVGILKLKNWARWLCIIWMALLIFFGLLTLPAYLQEINRLSKEGYFLLATFAFITRFVFGIAGIIFFSNSNAKKQFKNGVNE